MPVKVNIDKSWSQKIQRNLNAGLLEMAIDIERRAKILAPILTGALRNSGVVAPVPQGYSITFGSSRVPYARRRHYENKKNPQTIGYLQKAGESVARGDKTKYFRSKVW